jgi:DNA polymerase-3 subunit alpha
MRSLPQVEDFPERERLLMEREVLGFYLSSHPLSEHEKLLKTYCSHTTTTVSGLADRAEVMLGGMLSAIKMAHVKKISREGAPTKYANFDLEDMDGSIRCILWPDDFAIHGEMVRADAIVVVRGAIDRRGGGDEVNLIVNEIIPLGELEGRYTTGVVIRLDEVTHGGEKLRQIREIVRAYPGTCEVQLMLQTEDGTRVLLKSKRFRVEITAELKTRIDQLLGPGNFQLITARPEKSSGANNRKQRRSNAEFASGK